MPALALYFDECVDHRLLNTLRQHGCDVLTVQDAGTQQNTDEAQLLHATVQQRVFMSHNQVHFRRLHEQFLLGGRAHAGIILLPQTVPFSRLEIRALLMVEWVRTLSDRRSRLFAWSHLQRQLIHGYRIPGSCCSEDDVRHALAWR